MRRLEHDLGLALGVAFSEHHSPRMATGTASEQTLMQIESLLQQGANANQPLASFMGWMPIYYAVEVGDTGLLRVLARYVDVDLCGQNSDTPLMAAARIDDADAAKVLLEAGAQPDLTDEDGDTALHHCVFWKSGEYRSCTDTARLLIQAGANPDIPNQASVTFLQTITPASAEYDVWQVFYRWYEQRRLDTVLPDSSTDKVTSL